MKEEKSQLRKIGEFALIDLIKKQIGPVGSGVIGIGDDAAVVSYSSNRKMLMTTDMLTEGNHFTKRSPVRRVGHKALACSISDIAAMGGIPRYALISLGVSPETKLRYVKDLYHGLKQTAKKYGVSIIGGDTIQSKKMIINVVLIGEVPTDRLVLRNGAQKGDQIFVTGPLGGSLSSGHHLRFIPRVKESQHIVKFAKPSAMIDISDGLAADCGHILKASRVGARIDQFLIPLRKNAKYYNALYDGEDFELLFTVSALKAKKLEKYRGEFRFVRIGEIISMKEGFILCDKKGKQKQLETKGFTHF